MTRWTGGQAANTSLMQLFSDVCNIPVILPYSHSAAVVAGSAMLGRFAAEVAAERRYAVLETQEDVEKASYEHRERLWQIMVGVFCISASITHFLVLSLMLLIYVSCAGGNDKPRRADRSGGFF